MTPTPWAAGSGGGGAASDPGGEADVPLSATYTWVPSGERWIPRGRLPTAKVAMALAEARSMTVTSPEPSLLTQARGPWGRAAISASVSTGTGGRALTVAAAEAIVVGAGASEARLHPLAAKETTTRSP